MTQLTIKSYELPIIFVAVIIIAIIAEGYLDQYQWLLWLIILAIPTWIIHSRNQKRNTTDYPNQISLHQSPAQKKGTMLEALLLSCS